MKNGIVDLEHLINAIDDNTILISIMFANNEIGTIQPIKKISQIAKNKGIVFHTDAVQAAGNIKIDVKELEIDMLSISSHKIYGPKGVGALYVRDGIKIDKFINGGHQEKNLRAGTENVPGIIGLGEACKIASNNLDKHMNYLKNLRSYYISELSKYIKDIKINGSLNERLPGNANISFKNIDASIMLIKLDQYGICASAGSACNTGSQQPSHVLTAIGLSPEYSDGALRVTFGDDNTKEDVDYLIGAIRKIIK